MNKEEPTYVDITGVDTGESTDDPTVVHDDTRQIVNDDPSLNARFSKLWNFGRKGEATTQIKIDVHTSDSWRGGFPAGRELVLLLVTLVLLTMAVCLGISMAVMSTSRRPAGPAPATITTLPPKPAVCVTPECLEVGGYMLSNLNESADPCTDFYEYACGGFIASHRIPPGWSEASVRYDLQYGNIDKIEKVISDPSMRPSTRAYERKLNYYFRSCLDEYGRSQQSATHLLETINNRLGGWCGLDPSVLNGWNFGDALTKAHGDLAIRPFLRWYVYPSVYNRGTNAIRLYYPLQEVSFSYLLRFPQYQTAYLGYLQDVGTQLLTDGGIGKEAPEFQPRLDDFVNDVYQLDMKLAQVISVSYRYARFQRIMLSNLPNSQVDYQKLFTYIFQTAGVTGSTYVEQLYQNYTMSLDQTIAGLGVNKTRILNNYLVAYFIFEYATELAPAYRHAYFTFREKSNGYVSRRSIRDDCFTSARSLMTEAVSAEYVKTYFHPAHKDEINEIYNNIASAMKKKIQKLKWMDNATKPVALFKVDTMKEKLGYPDYMEDQDVMDGKYAALNIQSSSNYFVNLMAAAQFKKTKANNDLIGTSDEDDWTIPAYYTYAYLYTYMNEVRVPAGMIQFPYYWYKAPAAHKYGGIGTLVAEQMHRALDENGYRYFGNGSYTSKTWYSPQTLNNYQAAGACLASHYSSLKAGPYDVPGRGSGLMVDIKGDRYRSYSIAYIGGLRQTYQAYTAQQETAPDDRIPGLERSNAAAFFIAAAQTQCYVRHPATSWSRATVGSKQEDILLIGALQQMEEFQEAFQCPNDSRMVAEKKCAVF